MGLFLDETLVRLWCTCLNVFASGRANVLGYFDRSDQLVRTIQRFDGVRKLYFVILVVGVFGSGRRIARA